MPCKFDIEFDNLDLHDRFDQMQFHDEYNNNFEYVEIN